MNNIIRKFLVFVSAFAVMAGATVLVAHASTATTTPAGSISICKVIENASGTIVDGSAFPGNTFTVPGIASVPTSTASPIGVLPTTTFTTPLTLNTALFGSTTDNAQCVTYNNLQIGHYYYGTESIASSSSQWATPEYNDQDSGVANSISNVFPYSGQLFDNDPSNDAARNTDADGDINLLSNRTDRQLIVLNKFLGSTAATTTPTSTASSADISIVKTVDNSTPQEADFVNYTLTVKALGPATSTGVEASDDLPTGVALQNATASIGTFVPATGVWTIGDMSAGATATLVMDTQVLYGTAGQTIGNTANVWESASSTDPNLANNSSTVYITVSKHVCGCGTGTSTTPVGDISIVKTVDNATPQIGDTVNYTLAVSALGPATSTGVVATDTLPSGLTFENATATVGTYASSTGTWTIGDMSASSTANLMIAALVNSSDTVGQTITNTAIVGESASTTDNNPTNNSSSVSITIQPTGCTSNCGGGGGTTPASSTLTVNVSGLNASDTAQVAVNDITASTTNSTSTGNGSVPFSLTTNDQYAVTATTTNPNYSIATSTGCAGTLVMNATCNITFALATTTPSTDAGLSILKTVDNANPAPGATVNYTVAVTALGPATSTFVNTQDQLPMGLSLVSATTSVGTYDMSTGNWTIGTLSPNATATLTIAAQVNPNEAGQTITNTATVTELSSLVNQNLANNSSSVSITVQPAPCTSNCGGGGGTTSGGGGFPTAEIGITKSVDNATPNPGDTVHYTLTIQALGPNASIGVVATDTLPSGVTFVSASSSAGTYNSTTGTWTLGSVSPGANPTLVITATVNSFDTIGEVITNTATVGESVSVNDPLTGNNTASATITVGGSTSGGGGGGSNGGGGGSSIGVSSGGGGVIDNGSGGSTGSGQVLGASASCGIYLDQYIHPVRQYLNDPTEVKKLQAFLNMNLGTNLPLTGTYGPQTIAAVNEFQVKYHIEVLRPWLAYGLPTEYTPTSYVYKTTQRWINLIMCSSLNIPLPQLP